MIYELMKETIINNYVIGKVKDFHNNDVNLLQEILQYKNENKIKVRQKENFNAYNKPKLPSNWSWVKMEDIAIIITDGEHSTPNRIKENVGYYLLSARNILNGAIQLLDVDYVDENEYEKISKRCNPKRGDILISCSGSVGRSCVVEDDNNYVMVRSVAMVRLYKTNPYYIMYVLQSSIGKSQIEKLKKQTAQANLFLGAISNIFVPLPPMKEQEKIVERIDTLLSKLDALKPIENELKIIKNNFPIKMRKSILKDAFDGKYSSIPFNNWVVDKLINVCDEICTGNSISEGVKKTKYTNLNNGYNYIGTKDLNFNHSFDYENGIKIPFDESNFKFANANDILLCIEGGSAGKKIGILKEKVCYGNKLCKFSSSRLNLKFLYYYLQSPQFIKNFYDNISGIIGGVSINKIKTITISLPPIEEQQRIVDKLEQLLPLCDDIEKLINGKEN